jgi:hypothetical protein
LIGLTGQSLLVQIFGVLCGYKLLVQNVGGALVHALGATLGGLVVGFLMKKYLFKTDKKPMLV